MEQVQLMDIKIEWVEILAIVSGPILAVQAQVWLDKVRKLKNTRTDIFKTLMATRATRINPSHVHALNSIDLEFNDKQILEHLKQYKKILTKVPASPEKNSNEEIINFQSLQREWEKDCNSKFIDLLLSISNSLGYKFQKSDIEDGIYYPDGLARIDQENQMLRLTAINFFEGKNTAKFGIEYFPEVNEKNRINPLSLKKAIDLIAEEGCLPIKVVKKD